MNTKKRCCKIEIIHHRRLKNEKKTENLSIKSISDKSDERDFFI